MDSSRMVLYGCKDLYEIPLDDEEIFDYILNMIDDWRLKWPKKSEEERIKTLQKGLTFYLVKDKKCFR